MLNLKQWELPNNSKVMLPDGTTITFKGMDGMYAHWEQDGKLKIGNFSNGFIKVNDYYKVCP